MFTSSQKTVQQDRTRGEVESSADREIESRIQSLY